MRVCDVSFVMLAHNGAEFTRHALEGILAAEPHPWEMFLVDNCSDDATPELIREFEPRFREAGIAFTTWRNGENKGCSLARNEAWVKATSRYTVLIDNDAVVFASPDLKVLPGDTIVVKRFGLDDPSSTQEVTFEVIGRPSIYATHQEIKVKDGDLS